MEKLFVDSDSFIQHIKDTASSIRDDYVTSRYVGFIATTAVTVYEVAVKKLLVEFANAQHPILANFVSAEFEQINARIRTEDIREKYLDKFGKKYSDRFVSLLDAKEKEFIKDKGSIIHSYGNLITWRHEFVHQGTVPANATFDEAIKSYGLGKEVIFVLQQTFELPREEES